MSHLRFLQSLSKPRDDVREGACFMLVPTPESLVPYADVSAMDIGGPDGMHCTVLWCGPAADYEAKKITMQQAIGVAQAALLDSFGQRRQAPIGTAGKVITFGPTPEGDIPVVVKIDSDDARQFRRVLKRKLKVIGIEDKSQFSIYKPHMTLGYATDEEIELPSLGEHTLQFESLMISWGQHTEFLPLANFLTKDVYSGAPGIRPRIHRSRRLDKRRRRRALLRRARAMAQPRVQQKDIRRVRTPAGVRKYGQPIGSIIVRDGIKLANLTIDMDKPKPYIGWNRVKSTHGGSYDIGRYDEDGLYYAIAVNDTGESDWEDIVVDGAKNEEEASILLDRFVKKKDYVPGSGRPPIKGSAKGGGADPTTKPSRKEPKSDTNPERGRKKRPATQAEIDKWTIPPNWTDVQWNDSRDESVPDEEYDGLIATGTDEAGRTQSAYTLRWSGLAGRARQRQAEHLQKYFKKVAARIKAEAAEGVPEAMALLVSMVMGSRIGSEKDTKGAKKAYGVSTLEARHVKVFADGSVGLDFVGKKGERNRVKTKDAQIATMFKAMLKRKNSRDQLFATNEQKMNAYFKKLQADLGMLNAGVKVDVHTFRARLANAEALKSLNEYEKKGWFHHTTSRIDKKTGKKIETKKKIKMPPQTKADYNKLVTSVSRRVSEKLQNNPEQARKSYINHEMFDLYLGDETWRKTDPRLWKPGDPLTAGGVLASGKVKKTTKKKVKPGKA